MAVKDELCQRARYWGLILKVEYRWLLVCWNRGDYFVSFSLRSEPRPSTSSCLESLRFLRKFCLLRCHCWSTFDEIPPRISRPFAASPLISRDPIVCPASRGRRTFEHNSFCPSNPNNSYVSYRSVHSSPNYRLRRRAKTNPSISQLWPSVWRDFSCYRPDILDDNRKECVEHRCVATTCVACETFDSALLHPLCYRSTMNPADSRSLVDHISFLLNSSVDQTPELQFRLLAIFSLCVNQLGSQAAPKTRAPNRGSVHMTWLHCPDKSLVRSPRNWQRAHRRSCL